MLPTLARTDLVELLEVLVNVREGNYAAPREEGSFPRSIAVNKNMTLLMDIPAGRQWQ